MATNKPRFSLIDIPTAFFCDNPKANATRNEMIKNQVRVSECEQGDLEEVFFSDENISLINKQLIMLVYKKTNGQIKITEQSKASLIIVMRYIYLEYSRHLPYDVPGQIRELNCRVVEEIFPKIITEATQRIAYLDEINNPRKLIPLPINVHKGHRNIQSVSTTFCLYD
jgi:uncharacterized protein YukJ